MAKPKGQKVREPQPEHRPFANLPKVTKEQREANLRACRAVIRFLEEKLRMPAPWERGRS